MGIEHSPWQKTSPLLAVTLSEVDTVDDGGVVTIAPVSLNKEPSLSW